MASETTSTDQFWHTNISLLPSISGSFIEHFEDKSLPIKAPLSRGYRFFTEGYIHDFQVRNASSSEGCSVRSKCYRSMRKNEEPHKMNLVFGLQDTEIKSYTCSCAAEKGLCAHTIGLLYTISHYQLLGLKSIPPVISKTSLPQTWHIPKRTDGIHPRPVSEVIIEKVSCPLIGQDDQAKEKQKASGVTIKVYTMKGYFLTMSYFNNA